MTYDATDIAAGADVFGSDGAKVGTVAAVYPGYVVVEKGLFFPTDYYIPANAIASASVDQVYLNVTKDDALHSDWSALPADLETASVSPVASATDMTMTTDTASVRSGTDDEILIPVMEEELTATVRTEQSGSMRIEKDVVSEQVTLDVPITEERVRVERRVVDRPLNAADAEAFTDTVIEIPLETEVVDIQKTAHVAEEIVLSKESVERTQRVTDTVRKEQVFIDDETIDTSLTESGRGDNLR